MDSFEVTKVAGAVLATALVVLLARFITEQVYPEPEVVPHAYAVVPSGEPAEPETPAATQPEATGIATLIAAADPAAGRKVYKKCSACHTSDKGGKR